MPFAVLSDGTENGLRLERCAGTYLHGALEDPLVLAELLGRNVEKAPSREVIYDALADWFDGNVDQRLFRETYL